MWLFSTYNVHHVLVPFNRVGMKRIFLTIPQLSSYWKETMEIQQNVSCATRAHGLVMSNSKFNS